MTVAVVSCSATMPRYSKACLDEAQSLVSEYSYPTSSASSANALFAFSHGETSTDVLAASAAWCLPMEGSQYLPALHDHGSAQSGEIEDSSLFTSGQTTPKGSRLSHSHQPVETTWNTARALPVNKSQSMSRLGSSTSGCSSASNGPSLAQTTPMMDPSQAFQDDGVQVIGTMCPISDTTGSPICWPGYGLEIGMTGDCALSIEEMNPMNVAPTQVTFGMDGLPEASPSSSWDASSSISRTSSPNTIDESWRAAALTNSPMTFMGEPTSPEQHKNLNIVTDMQDTMASVGADMVIASSYKQQRSSVESDSPRDDARYKNVARGRDGLFHCPWEGTTGCSHKPEKLKCNYDKYVDSHLKPYKCKVASCEDARFSSTACRLRHEREAHGLHGHGNKPFLCTYEGCERSQEGNGFPRQWNLRDHMKRVHNDTGEAQAIGVNPNAEPTKGRKRKTETQDAAAAERKAPSKPAQQPGSYRKPSTKPLLDEWQEHYLALQGILEGLVAPGDYRNLNHFTEIKSRATEMAKITSQLISAPKPARDAVSKKGFASGG